MRNLKTDFTGRTVYMGIDVHKKTYSLHAICENAVVKVAKVPAVPEKLIKSIKYWFKGAQVISAYEAGFSGLVLHRALESAGIKNLVVHTGHLEKSISSVKTDKRDAKLIAKQLARGGLSSINIPSEKSEARRQVSRLREQVLRARVRVANQIKSRLHYFGLIEANCSRPITQKFLKEIQSMDIDEEIKISFRFLSDHWIFLYRQLEELKIEFQRQYFEEADIEEIYRSAPGVGPIIARTLANELGNLATRFKNQKSLYQFLGLVPREHSSGEKRVQGKINKMGPAIIRKMLVQAAWKAIGQDEALGLFYSRKSKEIGAQKAIVAVARKLIGRIRSCFIQNDLYCHGKI